MLKVVKVVQVGPNQIVSRFNEFLFDLILLAKQNQIKVKVD